MQSPTDTRRVRVSLGEDSYDILVGVDLIAQAGALMAPVAGRKRAAIVTDDNIAPLHLERLESQLRQDGYQTDSIILPAGESTKNMAQLTALTDQLLALKIERDDLVIALGGGVIGDIAGFAAAILRRGAPLAQIPTSLLAQVDSSVGGKTGVNSAHGKNLIGAFKQPKIVLADVGVLQSLPQRELQAGYAEVLKYALLGDAVFFDWLESNGAAVLAGDREAQIKAVETSVRAKTRIVEADQFERGDRALLNLGHTFGHALEAATGYSGRLLHGEGVSIGMALAFTLSARLGHCSQEEPSRVVAHLERLGLKRRLADIEGALPDADGLLDLMAQDKKVKAGVPTFILARSIGEAFTTRDAPREAVRDLLAEALAERA